MQKATKKEFITTDNYGAFICICGNEGGTQGFDTCDEKGHFMEPLIGTCWKGLYRCNECSRIIDGDTLQVIGSNVHAYTYDDFLTNTRTKKEDYHEDPHTLG